MRHRIGKFAASATLSVASVAAAVTSVRADDIPVFDTGVNNSHAVLAPGNPDPHYQLIQAPVGAGLTLPRQALVARPHPAYVPSSPVGTVGSAWIAPLIDTYASYASGTYVYRTTIDLTNLDPATAVIDGTLAVDDVVTDLRLNGVSLGQVGGGFLTLSAAFHIDHGFQSGVNTLDFVLFNSSGPSGLDVHIHGTASAAAPADAVPPVITGAYDRSLSWQGSQITLVAATLGITAVDAVDGSVPVALTPSVVGLGTYTVTASAHDVAGNVATSAFTLRVLDVTAPVIAGPAPASPSFDWHGSAIALTPASLGLSATDDVDGTVAVTLSPATAGLGSTQITARAADAAGNVTTRAFTVRVLDVTAPVLTGPAPATPTFEWHGSAIALTPALLGLAATDDVDGALAVALTPASAGLGSTSVTARATDAAGNTTSRSFNVNVLDVTAPAISGPTPATPTFEWHGSPIALTASMLGLAALDDVDGPVALTLSPAVATLGTQSVTAQAIDAAGNTSTRTFDVRVVDVTAPAISGPSPATPTFDWHGSAIALTPALLGLSAGDDVDGSVAVTLSPASVGLGSTSVTARAEDAAGNVSTRTFNVRVLDVTAPAITGPSPATPTFEWRGSAIALTPSLLGLSAADDVDASVGVALSPTVAGFGTTVVVATATDAAGNASSISFNVRVTDTTAPVFTALSVSPSVLTARNHAMAPVTVSATVTDAGDPAPRVRIVSITAIDAGLTFPTSLSAADWNVTGPLTADLRSERTGRGAGRTYVIAVACTDASGNTTTSNVTVFVPHDDCSRSEETEERREDRREDRSEDRREDRRDERGEQDCDRGGSRGRSGR